MLSDELHESYREKSGNYNLFLEELKNQFNVLIEKHNIELSTPITTRVKKWDSIVDKCQRYEINPKDIQEINDVAGIRIISVFKRDVQAICSIIEENFKVLRKENIEDRLDHTQFGYGSIHFEIALNAGWLEIPTLSRFSGLTVEVQVRTTSQHIWATASHILQYKREEHVPHPLKKSISRTAAILELVDLEFERLLTERDEYNNESEKMIENEKDLELDLDILRNILKQRLPSKNYDTDDRHDYGELLDDLKHFNIVTIKDLELIISKQIDNALKGEEAAVQAIQEGTGRYRSNQKRKARGVYYTHCGLIRLMLNSEFGRDRTNAVFSRRELIKRKKEK